MLSAQERSSSASPAKRAGERFLQPLFCGTQKGRGTLPDSRSQAHQQSALQTSVQNDNAETDPGANSPRGLVCVSGFKERVLSHSDHTASQTLSEVCLRGHSVPILCSPVWAGFGPTHFFKVPECSTFPPQSERDAHSQLSARLADFSSIPGHATQLYRHAASSLGVPRAMCQHAEEHSRPESVYNISGGVLRLCGDAGPPLSGALGDHFVFPAPFQARQLCSREEISEAAGSHGISVRVCHLGLLHMHPLQLWLKSRVPWTVWTSGRLSIAVSHGYIEALRPWCNTELISRGVPLGLVTSCVPIDLRLGSSVRGHANFGAVVRTAEPVAHKLLGAGSSVLSSKGFSTAAGTAACTDLDRQHVCSFLYKSPMKHSFQTSV